MIAQQPEQIPMKRKLASALVKELDDYWLIMNEVDVEPMIQSFIEIISDHSSSHPAPDDVLDKLIAFRENISKNAVLCGEGWDMETQFIKELRQK